MESILNECMIELISGNIFSGYIRFGRDAFAAMNLVSMILFLNQKHIMIHAHESSFAWSGTTSSSKKY